MTRGAGEPVPASPHVPGPVLPAPSGDVHPDPRLVPWPGFAPAAEGVVRHLDEALDMDLWLVTHVDGDLQVVVAAAGHWVDLAPPGTALPWAESFCVHMVGRRGPVAAPDVQLEPAYAAVATGVLARVRAYVGVPLLDDDGRLFGTLCAFSGTAQPGSLADEVDLVRLLGRLLSTVVAREKAARQHSESAAEAYALVEQDAVTGLRNRRGWEAVLGRETTRAVRNGAPVSVVVLQPEQPDDDQLGRWGALLTAASRPGDTLARTGTREFGLLAVECGEQGAAGLEARLRMRLALAGAPALSGRATRRRDETLTATEARARASMTTG